MFGDYVDVLVVFEVVKDPNHVFTVLANSLGFDFWDGKSILPFVIDLSWYKFDDDSMV